MGGISIWQLLIILAIVLLLFGTKKLRGLGTDLGGAIKGFRKAVKDEEQGAEAASAEERKLEDTSEGSVIEGEAEEASRERQKDQV